MLSLNSKCNRILVAGILLLVTVSVPLVVVGCQNWLPFHTVIYKIGIVFLIVAGVAIVLSIIIFLLCHGIIHGVKYCHRHYRLIKKLRRSLFDAGIYVTRYIGQEEIAVLPKIKVKFGDNLMTGEVQIQRRLKDRKRIEDYDISSALDCYIVEQSYISQDGNSYLYDIFDSSYDRQLVFENCAEFTAALEGLDDYSLLVDSVTTIPLHHSLISGQTGSGKSFFVQELIWEILSKKIPYTLYICDPKQSELYQISNRIAPERTADTVDSIIELLRSFHAELEKRMEKMKELLSTSSRVGVDYRDFNLAPMVLIFEEFLAFNLALSKCDKKTRDEVDSILSTTALTGRACGVFLWIIAQSTNATNIPTFLRDQTVFRAVMGNSDSSAYLALDSSADVPAMKFDTIGYGVYTYSGMTSKPKIFAAPMIKNFDILAELDKGVLKPSPSCKDGEGTP